MLEVTGKEGTRGNW